MISRGWNILAVHSQNSEAADPLADGLADAWRAWVEQHEPRQLRKVFLAIMGLLDEWSRGGHHRQSWSHSDGDVDGGNFASGAMTAECRIVATALP